MSGPFTGVVAGMPESTTAVPILPAAFGGGLLELAVFFLILAVVAGFLGVRGVAGLSMEVAKWLVILFVVLAVLSLLL